MEKEFKINCTGDCCIGDIVKFDRAVFEGKYPKTTFSHMEEIIGEIIKESYGNKKGQHTFTIQKDNGEIIRIKGRNLYRNGTWRKQWNNEKEREKIINEKHQRGNNSRKKQQERKEQKYDWSIM